MPSPSRSVLGLVALVLALSGCAEESEQQPEADLSASFAQSRPDLGTERAYVRLTNDGDTSVEVSGVGLSWTGYDYAELAEADSVLTPGRIVDLPIRLRDVSCDADPGERPEALVRVGEQTLTLPMVDAGATRLRGIWEQTCDTESLARALDLQLEPGWEPATDVDGAEMHGVLTLHRKADSEPITVTDLRGSVLLDFTPVDPGALPLTLEPDQQVALPVVLA
ncbi:MAG: hypothetical protein ACRDVZ_12150, partial [Jiangellaceae bacterium]